MNSTGTLPGALLVLGLGLFVLTQLVVRPLGHLRRATALMTAGDWDDVRAIYLEGIATGHPRQKPSRTTYPTCGSAASLIS